jgi:hypothetical protein
MLGDIMYETATNLNTCESDFGKWDKPGKSESSELWTESWLLQSIRLGCAACDRRRSGVCDHKATARDSTTTDRSVS